MPKTGPGKDIAGKIIDFLRQNDGKAVINLTRNAAKFDCTHTALWYSLHRLMEAGIVTTLGQLKRSARNQVEFILSDEFKEGDDWRKALKRKSSGGKAEAGPSVTAGLLKQPTPAKAHTDDECLQYRITLSRDLVEVYKRLEEAQGQIIRLQDEIKAKDKKIEDLTGEIEAEARARKREVNELATLELQLHELRGKTSDPKKLISFDNNGVIIAEGEGLPDMS